MIIHFNRALVRMPIMNYNIFSMFLAHLRKATATAGQAGAQKKNFLPQTQGRRRADKTKFFPARLEREKDVHCKLSIRAVQSQW